MFFFAVGHSKLDFSWQTEYKTTQFNQKLNVSGSLSGTQHAPTPETETCAMEKLNTIINRHHMKRKSSAN